MRAQKLYPLLIYWIQFLKIRSNIVLIDKIDLSYEVYVICIQILNIEECLCLWVHEIKIQHVNKGWRRNVKEWHRWISSSIMTHSNRQSSFLSAYQWVNKNKNPPIFLRKNSFSTIFRTCWKNEITFQSNYQQQFFTVVQFRVVGNMKLLFQVPCFLPYSMVIFSIESSSLTPEADKGRGIRGICLGRHPCGPADWSEKSSILLGLFRNPPRTFF